MKLKSPAILRNHLAEHIALMLGILLLAAIFSGSDVLWRWDKLIYDAQLSLWSRPAPDDIVIVAIDDQSLNDLGQWPWPRSVHAQMIERLQAESARAIGLDIIFSEADSSNPQSDRKLAMAIKRSGKVILPVYMSQSSARAVPLEALPLPSLTQGAAALGHVNLDISRDGIARRVWLREGIGQPHWPHYALALLNTLGEARSFEPSQTTQGEPAEGDYSPMQWSREMPYLIPYAGPPEHFTRIGYSQVLSGLYPEHFFRDKIVLIGTTAEGMGDAFPTPLSGHSRNMPGVEIVANIIDALRHQLYIHELNGAPLMTLTLLLIALPLMTYPWVKPATTLLALFGFITSTILLVALLLWLFSIWLPAATILLFQLLSYPLWSWRRLDLALRHMNSELDLLSSRQQSLSLERKRTINDEMHFIKLLLPLKSWVLQDSGGQPLAGEGAAPRCNLSQLTYQRWQNDGHRYWALIDYHGQACRLGLSLGHGFMMDDHHQQLLDNLLTGATTTTPGKHLVEDVLQARINQVKAAGDHYQQLRRIIDDSLAGMADGILICNGRGQIMLSNRRAAWYLCADDDARLQHQPLSTLLSDIELKDGDSWKQLLQRVLFERQRILARARQHSGRDLMIEISPLTLLDDPLDGFIINLSDITLLKNSERKRNQILDFLSHDLRSPLSSMLAMIELARNKSNLAEMRAMLNVMEKNTEKTLHLAEQFLQLSRATTDEKIQFYEIDFNNIVLNATDQLWALSSKKEIRIEHRFEQEECWTMGDGDLLERAMVNLLSNAIKYSPADSRVEIQVSVSQHEICCCVSDQGPGIAEADIPQLFELFKRAHGNGVERIQGIGLGLAFVDAVAKRHSGHVYVESELGRGSRFCLIIPLHTLADCKQL